MIKKILLVLTVVFAFFACKSEDEELIPNQIAAIERLLTTYEMEYDVVGGVYRHFGARGAETAKTIENGNLAGFMFEIYKLSGAVTLDPTKTISSNKPYVHQALNEIGVDTQYWPQGAYAAKLGSKSLIDGLNKGLIGCREGDSVLLFITSDLALGDAPLGPAPADSAMVYIINIESVTK